MNTILQKKIEEAAKFIAVKNAPLIGTRLYDDCCYNSCIEAANFALQNQWISVEEALPEYDEVVIGMDYMPELDWDDQTIIFVHRSDNPNVVTDKNKFCVYPPTFCKVTHWMEIPTLKGGEE